MACFYEETFDMEKLPMSTVNAVTHKVDSTKIDKLCKELTTIYDKCMNIDLFHFESYFEIN